MERIYDVLQKHGFDYDYRTGYALKTSTDMSGNLCCISVTKMKDGYDVKVHGIGYKRESFGQEAKQLRSELYDCK